MSTNKERKPLNIGQWYIYLKGDDEDVCKRCNNMTGKPFLATVTLDSTPFHPNCRCRVVSYQSQMMDGFKKAFPTVSNTTLDTLLSKGYYKYSEVARPVYVDNDYYYYRVNSKLYKVNMATLHGLGVFPNGQYIVGATGESENVRLLESILAGEEEADQRVIGINIPLKTGYYFNSPQPAPTYTDGDRRTIAYFGQIYHGQVCNGELYLDEYCQRNFIAQLQIATLPWQWSNYKELSVSELMKAASGYQKQYKPYDPSKPLPVLKDDVWQLINGSELAGKRGITTNIPISATAQPDGKTLSVRCVSSLNAGDVTVTDYLITTKTKNEWTRETRGFYDALMGATDLLSPLAEINDVTLLISNNVVTIPLTLIGQGANVVNQIGTAFPPQSVQRLDRALQGIKEETDAVMLLCYAAGHNAYFDEHGNLSISYTYQYGLL